LAANTVWQTAPYPHERRMFAAYLTVAERRFQPMRASDVRSLAILFEWLKELTPEQTLQNDISGRKLYPPLLTIQENEIFTGQIRILTDRLFLDSPNYQQQVNGMVRGHMMVLNQYQVAKIPIFK
jgi:hypothetical protein